MLTEWGEKVTPETAWKEYPRPSLEREGWTNLNGVWKYSVTKKSVETPPGEWSGEILVPFAIESALSGVKKRISAEDAIWYNRNFTSKADGKHTILNFEAVDYESTVWVNGTKIGTHTGGNLPFSFDITDFLKDGDNTLTLKVTDATDTEYQLHGKQVSEPQGIWYTPVSGIWQTVWMEKVPQTHIVAAKITSEISGKVTIALETGASAATVVASLDGKEVATATGSPDSIVLQIPEPKLWSPDSPTLYDLTITAGEDTVKSYVGVREASVKKGGDGHLRLLLNGKPLFQFGTLDQGWWPDGLLTPPSDAAMISDIDFLKAAGFNTIRKHIKVEPRRYYAHCDKVGMLVWQDQVSSGTGAKSKFKDSSPAWIRLRPNPRDATWPDAEHEQYMKELKGMIDHLYNHPSIVQWVPFNEAWGQHRTMEVGKWIVGYDKTRQINIASGGNFHPVGDIVDGHQYPHPDFRFDLDKNGRFDKFVKVVGEFGGHGFPVEGHLWDIKARNWGYGGLPKDKDEWIERYTASIEKLVELKGKGIAASIYTQTTDVEGEINGLITYDRKVRKLSPEQLKAVLDKSGLMSDELVVPDSSAPKVMEKKAFSSEAVAGEPAAPVASVVDAMPREEIEAGLKSHDKALYVKEGWIRDPYLTLGPDDMYYLTGTTMNEDDPRERSDPYNVGLKDTSAVGDTMRVWRSKDLIDWEYLGAPYTLKDSIHKKGRYVLWAPEAHWIQEMNRWAIMHCPQSRSDLLLSEGPELKGLWSNPMGENFKDHHDPSLFKDGDQWWILSENTNITPIASDFSKFTGKPIRIDPSGERPDAAAPGKMTSRIGHEGATMIKVGGKYVHLGTAWSTDKGRRGSYNLYYSTADTITGPYGPRKFAGRFLGHGTPFQTRDGKWWCTAFFNGNVPPLDKDGIEGKDLGNTAQTINQRGLTIVPMDVKVLDDGEIHIRAIDPAYGTPGPDESQNFND